MARSVETFKAELQKIRTGRAHPGILDQVHVEYYGSTLPISQVANVTLLDARTISVQPWEKGMGAKIEKAIRESDLGLNPAVAGRPAARADAGPDRGAPQGLDQGRAPCGRGGHGGGAQRAPRCQRARQAADEGQADRRGRGASLRGRDPEAHRPHDCRGRQLVPARNRRSWRSEQRSRRSTP